MGPKERGMSLATTRVVDEMYHRLYDHFGPQQWWPAETSFEVLVGAVLTQNTNWGNVTKAIAVLKSHDLMTYQGLSKLTATEIAPLIRASGYYNIKAKRLKNLMAMIDEIYAGELAGICEDSLYTARENLLAVNGVGQETADSILLYACNKPVFVVDTYTHRIVSRHFLIGEESSYNQVQDLFLGAVKEDAKLYGEYHALLVKTAATYCKKAKPRCESCPLQGLNW